MLFFMRVMYVIKKLLEEIFNDNKIDAVIHLLDIKL